MEKDYSQFKEIVSEALSNSRIHDVEDIRSWTSMQVLIVVSAIDEHFDVLISHEEMGGVTQFQELFNLVTNKLTNG